MFSIVTLRLSKGAFLSISSERFWLCRCKRVDEDDKSGKNA